MRKLLSIISAACIALSLTGCAEEIPMEDCVNTNLGAASHNQIMQTENGYYYNATQFGTLALRYHDNATDSNIFLCAKPECTHDGDKFCTATSETFRSLYTVMYGGYIYAAVTEADGEQVHYRLLKASLDGTELTEVCTYMQTSGNNNAAVFLHGDTRTMVIHRGYAFIPYTLSSNDRAVAGVCGTVIVDLQSGKYKLLTEYDREETQGPIYVKADGDYFYYQVEFKDYYTDSEFRRYNIKTGEEEILPIAESLKEAFDIELDADLIRYTIVDGKLWYACSADMLRDIRWEIYIYDPETNTTTLAEQFSDKLVEYEEYTDNGETLIAMSPYADPDIMYDGQYIYFSEHGFYGHPYMETDMKVYIFTPDGEMLTSFAYEREGTFLISILDGNMYIQTDEKTVFCPVSDIISGSVEWTELYKFENEGAL